MAATQYLDHAAGQRSVLAATEDICPGTFTYMIRDKANEDVASLWYILENDGKPTGNLYLEFYQKMTPKTEYSFHKFPGDVKCTTEDLLTVVDNLINFTKCYFGHKDKASPIKRRFFAHIQKKLDPSQEGIELIDRDKQNKFTYAFYHAVETMKLPAPTAANQDFLDNLKVAKFATRVLAACVFFHHHVKYNRREHFGHGYATIYSGEKLLAELQRSVTWRNSVSLIELEYKAIREFVQKQEAVKDDSKGKRAECAAELRTITGTLESHKTKREAAQSNSDRLQVELKELDATCQQEYNAKIEDAKAQHMQSVRAMEEHLERYDNQLVQHCKERTRSVNQTAEEAKTTVSQWDQQIKADEADIKLKSKYVTELDTFLTDATANEKKEIATLEAKIANVPPGYYEAAPRRMRDLMNLVTPHAL